eukprot:2009158-Prymnesium_polylepis.1
MKVASELLTLYAERQELQRKPCAPDGEPFAAFASSFQFEPTADQVRSGWGAGEARSGDRRRERRLCAALRISSTTCATPIGRWIDWSAATSASARPRWRCA